MAPSVTPADAGPLSIYSHYHHHYYLLLLLSMDQQPPAAKRRRTSKGQPDEPRDAAMKAAKELLERASARHAARTKTNAACLARYHQMDDVFTALFPQSANTMLRSPQLPVNFSSSSSSPSPAQFQNASPWDSHTATPGSDTQPEGSETFFSAAALSQEQRDPYVSGELDAYLGLDFGLTADASSLPERTSTAEARDIPAPLDDELLFTFFLTCLGEGLNFDLDIDLLADAELRANLGVGCQTQASPDRECSQVPGGTGEQLKQSTGNYNSSGEQDGEDVRLHGARKRLAHLQARLQAYTKFQLNNTRQA